MIYYYCFVKYDLKLKSSKGFVCGGALGLQLALPVFPCDCPFVTQLNNTFTCEHLHLYWSFPCSDPGIPVCVGLGYEAKVLLDQDWLWRESWICGLVHLFIPLTVLYVLWFHISPRDSRKYWGSLGQIGAFPKRSFQAACVGCVLPWPKNVSKFVVSPWGCSREYAPPCSPLWLWNWSMCLK